MEGNESMQGFNWDDTQGSSFLSSMDTPDDEGTTVLDDDKPKEENKEKDTKEEDKKEEEVVFDFGGEQEDSTTTEGEPEDFNADINAVNFLKDRGVISFELEEGTEMTPDLAKDIITDSFNDSVEEKIEEMFKDLPPVVRNLNQFVLKGGDVNEFMSQVAQSANSSNINIDTESGQEQLIREELKLQDLDDDLINTAISSMKDSGTLESQAKKANNKRLQRTQKEQERIVEQKRLQTEREVKATRELRDTVAQTLKSDEINTLNITGKDRAELPNYLTEKTVTLNNGAKITQFQNDLLTAINDTDKAITIAKLLRSDLDLSTLANTAATKVTEKVKSNLRRTSQGQPASQGRKQTSTNKRLADYF